MQLLKSFTFQVGLRASAVAEFSVAATESLIVQFRFDFLTMDTLIFTSAKYAFDWLAGAELGVDYRRALHFQHARRTNSTCKYTAKITTQFLMWERHVTMKLSFFLFCSVRGNKPSTVLC